MNQKNFNFKKSKHARKNKIIKINFFNITKKIKQKKITM